MEVTDFNPKKKKKEYSDKIVKEEESYRRLTKEEAKEPKEKLKGLKMFFILVFLIIPGIFLYNFMKEGLSGDTTNENIVLDNPNYQEVILLVKYNKSLCPELKVKQKGEVIDIKQVPDIKQEINYARLGKYDIFNKSTRVKAGFINLGNCSPEINIIPEAGFLNIVNDYRGKSNIPEPLYNMEEMEGYNQTKTEQLNSKTFLDDKLETLISIIIFIGFLQFITRRR